MVAAVVGTLGAVVPSSSASAETRATDSYRIYNSYSGLCVEVPGASTQVGVTWKTNYCNFQTSNQYFFLYNTSVQDVYNIGPEYDMTLCADTYPAVYTFDGQVKQYTCDSTGSQKWLLVVVGTNLVKFQSIESGYCLRSYTLSAGSNMVQGYCNDHNAIWSLYTY